MKAIAVRPGTPNSMHLRDVNPPRVTDVEEGRGVLVEVIRVGVDGTDKEINAAEYGEAPPGHDYLITGHENFGRVMEVGPNVPSVIRPGGLVVATVRRPGMSAYDRIGLQDMTTDDVYFERGINLRHGYLTERYVENADYVVSLPDSLEEVGVLLEPMTVGEKGVNQAYEIQRRLKIWRAAPRAGARRRHDRPSDRARDAAARPGGELRLAPPAALPQQRPDRGARRHLLVVVRGEPRRGRRHARSIRLDPRRHRLQPPRVRRRPGARQERRAGARRASPAATAGPRSRPT